VFHFFPERMGLPASPFRQIMALTDSKFESSEAGDYLRQLGFAGNSGGSAQSLLRVAQGKSSKSSRRQKAEAAQLHKAVAGHTDAQGSEIDPGRNRGAEPKSSAPQCFLEKDGQQSTASTLALAECPEEEDDAFDEVLINPYELAIKPSSSTSCSTATQELLQTPASSAGELRERRQRPRFARDHKKRVPTPTAWRLAWCHEHCHKVCNDDRRRSLWHISRRCGASLVCLKKAARFAMWLTSASRPRYVLLTDWREAKPCMSFIPNHTTPTVTVVHADCDQTFRKASEWVKQLPPEFGPAVVVRDLEEVNEDFLQSYMGPPAPQEIEISAQRQAGTSVISDHFDTDDEKFALEMDSSDIASPEPPASVQQQQQAAIAVFMQMGSSPPSSSSSVGATFLQASPPSSSGSVGDNGSQRPGTAPGTAPGSSQALTPTSVTALTAPVFNTLWPVFSSCTDQQLNQILADAMPECYTD